MGERKVVFGQTATHDKYLNMEIITIVVVISIVIIIVRRHIGSRLNCHLWWTSVR